jgi:hypothetical protein
MLAHEKGGVIDLDAAGAVVEPIFAAGATGVDERAERGGVGAQNFDRVRRAQSWRSRRTIT